MNASAVLEKLASGADLTTSEKFFSGGVVTLLAMAIVFAILILLIFAILLMGKILHREAPKVAPVASTPTTEEEDVDEEDPSEVVAVITAAIAATMGTSQNNIRVKRIERVGTARLPWATTGTQEAIRPLNK